MHLSMHNWMRSEPIEVTVARLARFGYGSIEIKGEPDQYDTKDVRALLASHGLKCWGAVTLTLAERNLCAKDEKQRAASVQYVKDCVTMVKELDGQEITIVMVSLTYFTDMARAAGCDASRLRSPSISVTEPQHVMPCSPISFRTCFVSYFSGSPLISIAS